MKIFKISQKVPVSKVEISEYISQPLKEELTGAKGVMENYLKDKEFKVAIRSDIFEHDDKYVSVCCLAPKVINVTSVNSEGDIPFLRKVYMGIEKFHKENFQAK